MQESGCLVFNPIMVDNYAAFFNCTLMDGASDLKNRFKPPLILYKCSSQGDPYVVVLFHVLE